jgi:hypothetical protein
VVPFVLVRTADDPAQGADLSMSATLTEVGLEGRDGEAPLWVEELELPTVPLWVTYTY